MKRSFSSLLVFVLAACGGQTTPPASPPEPTPSTGATSTGKPPEDAGQPRDVAPSSASASAPSASPVESASPAEPPPKSALAGAMREHFKDTETIRAAVIHGPLRAAVTPAHNLVELSGSAQLPAAWKRWAEHVRDISSRISSSPDVATTAAATADIGVTCGSCHAGGKGPKAKPGDPPPLGDSVTSRMRRHAWATERLWEGLFVPSAAAWKTGSEALEGGEFPKEILKKGGVHARDAASRFGSIVAKLKDQQTPEARAAQYASLLETCAECHMATRK